ncbi:hypothetical protein HDU84_004028 [Entophlyctis sp. JEL0112]|nr:hypothetical protein HDU84_004028 [Entophlyctis sp. JEL0112]
MQSPYYHDSALGYFPELADQHQQQQQQQPQLVKQHANVYPTSPYDGSLTSSHLPLPNVDFLLPSPLSSPPPTSPTPALAVASNGVLVPVDHLQLYEFILASNVPSSYASLPASAEPQLPASPAAASAPASAPFVDQTAAFPIYQQASAAEQNIYSLHSQHAGLPPAPAMPVASAPARGANVGAQCFNCGTTETSAWRKDTEGRTVCNACGLYKKQRGYDRPAAFPFRKAVVRRRMRVKKTPARGAADAAPLL